MTRNDPRGAVAAACLLALTGCLATYRPPAPGEPAALVKVKVAYDHRTALKQLPDGANGQRLALHVNAGLERRTYAAASKEWPEALLSKEAAVLDVVPVLLHPGKPLTLAVRLSMRWTTSEMETVQETERIPKTVTKTDWSYDFASKRSVPRTYTVTEYETRSRTVTKLVTKPHEAGCTASVHIRPEKDDVYLIDYTNLAMTEDCSATAFRQVLNQDGTFGLLPTSEDSTLRPAPSTP